MSLVVAVHVVVTEGEQTYVNVARTESILPARPSAAAVDPQHDVDLIDLARAALDRMIADVQTTADGQVVQLRALLAHLADQ